MRLFKLITVGILLLGILTACYEECNHEFVFTVTSQPSCSQQGEEAASCKHCTYSYSNTIPKIAHNYDEGIVEKAPTCKEEGIMKYSCVACDAVRTEAIPVAIHTFGTVELTKVPNCTEQGEKTATCHVCGMQVVVARLMKDSENHILTTTVVQKQTCEEGGVIRNDCTLCEKTELIYSDPLPHQYGPYEIIEEASCMLEGVQERKCYNCGNVERQVLAKKAHTWNTTVCGAPAACTVCNYYNAAGIPHEYNLVDTYQPTDTSPGRRNYACRNCGDTYKVLFGRYGDYDMNWVRREAIAYAESLGFIISDIPDDQPYKQFSLRFWQADSSGGDDYILKVTKAHIDSIYNQFATEENWQYKRPIYISVSQWESYAEGCVFHVDIYLLWVSP